LIRGYEKFYEDTSTSQKKMLVSILTSRVATGVRVEYDELICRGKTFPRDLSDKVALAVTFNPWLDLDARPTQIQLCPWFVQWTKDHKYKMQKDAMMTTIGKTLIKVSGKTPFSLAQIGKLLFMFDN
jgi:hypothetical protein